MDTEHFTVSKSADPARARSPWKLEVRASFSGRKIRRFCSSEAEAWDLGRGMVEKIRDRGISGLSEQGGHSMAGACETFRRRNDGKSRSHTDKVAQVTGMLERQFKFAAVAPADLDRWFSALPGSETTRAMYFRYVRMFFRWAARMEIVPRDPSTVLDAPRAAVGRNILAPRQMLDLLKLDMPDWLRACTVLGGFAGLRTEELVRMVWQDIDPAAGEIHIRPGVGKDTGGFLERIVDFTPPLERRAGMFSGSGPIVPVSKRNFHYAREALASGMGWDSWPDNCLRHSFATYHLAECRDPGRTAYQMGHTSPSMVQRVYAVPARKVAAADWWGI